MLSVGNADEVSRGTLPLPHPLSTSKGATAVDKVICKYSVRWFDQEGNPIPAMNRFQLSQKDALALIKTQMESWQEDQTRYAGVDTVNLAPQSCQVILEP